MKRYHVNDVDDNADRKSIIFLNFLLYFFEFEIVLHGFARTSTYCGCRSYHSGENTNFSSWSGSNTRCIFIYSALTIPQDCTSWLVATITQSWRCSVMERNISVCALSCAFLLWRLICCMILHACIACPLHISNVCWHCVKRLARWQRPLLHTALHLVQHCIIFVKGAHTANCATSFACSADTYAYLLFVLFGLFCLAFVLYLSMTYCVFQFVQSSKTLHCDVFGHHSGTKLHTWVDTCWRCQNRVTHQAKSQSGQEQVQKWFKKAQQTEPHLTEMQEQK